MKYFVEQNLVAFNIMSVRVGMPYVENCSVSTKDFTNLEKGKGT